MALPHDPDLDPIKPPSGGFPPIDGADGSAPLQRKRRPVVLPAEPEKWARSYSLLFPLTVDGERLEVIKATALTGNELLDCVASTNDDDEIQLMVRAMMCGLPHEVFPALHADDSAALEDVLRPLLPAVIRLAGEADTASLVKHLVAGV